MFDLAMQLPGLDHPDFVQDPYPFYARARALGRVHDWPGLGMRAVFHHDLVHALLRDRRLGRAPITPRNTASHLVPFARFERASLLELEGPDHARMRKLILRAFTSRSVERYDAQIQTIAADLIDRLPDGPVDLIRAYCQPIPVLIIARLLGVGDDMAPQLVAWSSDMVAMYQSGRDASTERRAAEATRAFTDFLNALIAEKRRNPGSDLLCDLIRAEQDGARLSHQELVSTCILLLNAGHEATVHAMGNAIKCLLEHGTPLHALSAGRIAGTVEELLRFDPPLHVFTRYVYAPLDIDGHQFSRGDEVALVLGSACRDPELCADPDRFDPDRSPTAHTAFGGGVHFCVGAPLARKELQIALAALFHACPNMTFSDIPTYSNSYHFHKLDNLQIFPGSGPL